MSREPLDSQADTASDLAALRRRSTTIVIARVISYIAYALVVAALAILAFGFLLELFAANPDAPFTRWVYRHLAETMEPFRGIFPQAETPGGSTVDVSILFAMFVYSLVGLGMRSLLDWLTLRRDRLARRMQRDEALLARQRTFDSQQDAGYPPRRGATEEYPQQARRSDPLA